MSTEVPIYLIAFRLIETSHDQDLYSLVYGDDDSPLLLGGRVALFRDVKQVMDAYALLPIEVRKAGAPPEELAYTYDLPTALGRLGTADTDPSRQLLNCLNVMFDFVKALGPDLPELYKGAMSKLANHLTFSEDYGNFLRKEGIDRQTIRDGMYWCLGLVASHAEILSTDRGGISE
jgi:hypothetical protein